jgi:protein-S-isoprenylcysteine O-methyltransferase Ste14
MGLAAMTTGLRWLGGLAAAATLAVIFQGVGAGLRRQPGRASGRATTWLRSPAFYGLASLVFFGACAFLWRPLPLALPSTVVWLALLGGSLLYFGGLWLAVWGRLALGRMYFVSTGLGAQLFADHQLITRGPYSYVRHPMYAGLTLAVLGGLLLYQTWTMAALLLLPLALWRRARREEQVLASEFGAAWQAYCQRVPGWLPRLR